MKHTFSKIFLITLLSFIFSFNFTFAQNLELCKALNSLEIYGEKNFLLIQKYLQKFFPKLLATGKNDQQNIYYIIKFQYAFGLYQSGFLDQNTLSLIRDQNSCFDLNEDTIPEIIFSYSRNFISENILNNLLSNFIYSSAIYSTSTSEIIVTSNTNFSDSQVQNNIPVINQDITKTTLDNPIENTEPDIINTTTEQQEIIFPNDDEYVRQSDTMEPDIINITTEQQETIIPNDNEYIRQSDTNGYFESELTF